MKSLIRTLMDPADVPEGRLLEFLSLGRSRWLLDPADAFTVYHLLLAGEHEEPWGQWTRIRLEDDGQRESVMPAGHPDSELVRRARAAYAEQLRLADEETQRRAQERRDRLVTSFAHDLETLGVDAGPLAIASVEPDNFYDAVRAETEAGGLRFGYWPSPGQFDRSQSALALLTPCERCGEPVWRHFSRSTHTWLTELGRMLDEPTIHPFDCLAPPEEA